ncbi:MAG: class I SAM-dependent methyltransferase [Desulfobulbaceae bacterium]|nr:class I SAM-dependent methyltransferase [Desulfobulbaceae bacterium]
MKQAHLTDKTCNEREIFEQVLSLDGKRILELGCGKPDLTRLIATTGSGREIMATEVDEIQHKRNLLIDDLPNVTFVKAGSERIPSDDESFDVVFMFKSLHHVPMDLMDLALKEIKRVLKPGGMAYISEPVFAGDFNEVIRLFNDEEKARIAAYRAIENAVNNQDLFLVDQMFFNIPMFFKNFAEFERIVINVTHSNFQLSPELKQRVKKKFLLNMKEDGAHFQQPVRVDLLQKK